MRGFAAVAAAGCTVVTIAVVLPAVGLPDRAERGAAEQTEPRADVVARPDQAPPRDLVAAGRLAVSAHYTVSSAMQPNGDRLRTYHWRLYNTTTERYEKVPWAYLDVAPGMRQAAVLEGELPSKRIGILDMSTGKVTRWIELDRGVAAVDWSPDGKRLIATTYSKNPDRMLDDTGRHPKNPPKAHCSRTGFYLVDVAGGDSSFRALPDQQTDEMGWCGNSREDARWSQDGRLIHTPVVSTGDGPVRVYYDLRGESVPAPRGADLAGYEDVLFSPDGRLVAGGQVARPGSAGEVDTRVLDVATGEPVGRQQVQRLLGWAGNHRLIAWGYDGEDEFRGRMLLVDIDGGNVRPLTAFSKGKGGSGWTPVLTER